MSIQSKIVDQVGIISLDRPEKANAYDRAHLDALAEAFDQLTTECAVVIIRSSDPRFFCAGADLNELKNATPEDARQLRSQAVFTAIARSQTVSIAVIDGPAVAGGCELALAADLRVIGANAIFKLPETSLGIIPAAGGCTRLTTLLGASVAKSAILGGEAISSDQAILWGLGVDGGDDADATAIAWAERLAKLKPEALRAAKRIIDAASEDASLAEERAAQSVLYALRADND